MDELIVCRNCDSPYCHGCNIYLLYQMLKAGKFDAIKDGNNTIIPAADVVPVVRCRDCKHRDPEDRKCDCGGLEHAHMFPVSDDWFCADGERKDGDGE